MNNLGKKLTDISLRYFIMILGGISGLWIFSKIFTPLTVYSSYFLLELFFDASLSGTTVFVNGIFPIEIIEACVASSAYYLLFILNLSTPKITFKNRLTIILESFLVLLIINILRIFLLSLIYISGSNLFETIHMVFWYFANILFVVGIWFFVVREFKLKEIPFYSDLKFFFSLRKRARAKK